MAVSPPLLDYRLVFSFYHHPVLGLMLSPYAIRPNEKGQLTYDYRKVHPKNAAGFFPGIASGELKAIQLLHESEPEQLVPRLFSVRAKPHTFLQGDITAEQRKLLQKSVKGRLAQVIELVSAASLFLMNADGYPAWKPVVFHPSALRARFHFIREGEVMRYFPILKAGEQVVQLFKDESYIATAAPGRVLVGEVMYSLHAELDAAKLTPFLTKPYVEIPVSSEPAFLDRFVKPLLKRFPVTTNAFRVEHTQGSATPVLNVSQDIDGRHSVHVAFEYEGTQVEALGKVVVRNGLDFKVINRDENTEEAIHALLLSFGFAVHTPGYYRIQKPELVSVKELSQIARQLTEAQEALAEYGVVFREMGPLQGFTLAGGVEKVAWVTQGDWLDLTGSFQVGPYEIPIAILMQAVIAGKDVLTLPNGEQWAIPEEWYARYSDLSLRVSKDGQAYRMKAQALQVLHPKSSALMPESHTIELPEAIHAQLRPYQQAGFTWICEHFKRGQGVILADDMGLGKTVQAIASISWLLELLKASHGSRAVMPVLVIAPTSLLFNWRMELARFAPSLQLRMHYGQERAKSLGGLVPADVVLTSYGTLRIDSHWLRDITFSAVVADEAQQFKNAGSQSAHAVLSLQAKVRLALSGTPIENRLTDLWPLVTFARPGILPSYERFLQSIVKPVEKDPQAPQGKRLAAVLSEVLLRRTKAEVARDLPERSEQVIYTDMTEAQSKIYTKYKSAFRSEFAMNISRVGYGSSKMMLLRALTSLRQIANDPRLVDPNFSGQSGKHVQLRQFLRQSFDEGHKVLLFSQFVRHLAIVQELAEVQCQPHFLLHGSMKPAERQAQVEGFQAQEGAALFMLSLKAGGMGLNLTCADYVVLLDPWWNPAVEAQAIDRTHRIGQTKPVFAYKFITRGSIEEKILNLQISKKAMADLFTGDNLGALTQDEALSLLEN